MTNRIAAIISILFHPLLMATYLFAAFTIADPFMVLPPGYSIKGQWLIVLVVSLTTFVIPSLSMVMLKVAGYIKSLKLEERRDRFIPFIYITLFYGFTAYYFNKQMLVTNLAGGVFIVVALMILISAIINFYWKISIHGVAMGGMVGIFLLVSYINIDSNSIFLLFGSIIISGIVLSSRLRLYAHTPLQVYLGFLLGFIVSLMAIFWS